MDTSFVTQEYPQEHIVLIVDKTNQFGDELAIKIQAHATVVLVSEKKPETQSIIHIPYTKRVPEIPVGTYSHIFLFTQEQEEHELLIPLAQKAQADNAKFVYILPYWFYQPEITEHLASLCKQWILVLLGDVFDNKNITTHIGQILHQAKNHKTIALADLGLETLRPVAFSDAIVSLLRIGFGFEKEHICFVFSKHPFTALSVVHALQKVDPLLRIDFIAHQSIYPNSLLPEGMYLLETDYAALKKIQDIYVDFQTKKVKKEEKTSPVMSKKAQKVGKWRLFVLPILIGIFWLIMLPTIWTLTAAGLGGVLLNNATNHMEKGSFMQAQKYAQASNSLFAWAEMGSTVVDWEANVVGQEQSAQVLSLQLHAIAELSQIVTEISLAGENFQQVMNGQTLTPQATFTNGTVSLKTALLTLQSMSYLPKTVQDELTPLEPLITLVAQTVDIAPSLFGLDKPKTYLVLLQNNAELRPGGGVIDAYAIVKIDKGRIGDLNVHDISDADNELKGHVEPPFALSRYMNEQNWYLKDSNFSADNLKNAQTEAFFIQQELRIRVDGVVAMDVDFIKSLIGQLGGIHLVGNNQTVTADNLPRLIQAASQSQNKQFLPALLAALEKELQSGNISYTQLGGQLVRAFTQKHLMVAFPDPTIQQLFTINNMSSVLWDARKSDGNVVNDFAGINEANLGQNQINQFIKRSIAQDVTVNPSGTISATMTIHYDNANDTGTNEGPYKNYLRVLLPGGAQISNIFLNNIPQSRFPAVIDPKVYEAENFKPPKGMEIEHTQEGGKEEYGFFVTVPSNAMIDVTVSYVLSQKLDLTESTSTFDELLFKQPGTESDPYSFTLSYPNFLTLITGPKEMKKTASTVAVTAHFATDEDYQFTFSNQ